MVPKHIALLLLLAPCALALNATVAKQVATSEVAAIKHIATNAATAPKSMGGGAGRVDELGGEAVRERDVREDSASVSAPGRTITHIHTHTHSFTHIS